MNIIYVGRLTYDKGMDLLLSALKALNYDGTLTIVGDGEMRGYIEREKSSCGFSVDMKGWVPQREVARYYRAADIFVHPARWPDPAPRAIVDALSCGLPVVVPDTGGSSWIAGKAGEVFRTGDEKSLRRALIKLMSDASVRTALAAQAAASAERFRKGVVYPQLEGILRAASRV